MNGGSSRGSLRGGGAHCRMSVLRNGNVAYLGHLFSTMSTSHVEFKKMVCRISLYFVPSSHMSLSPMSHVEFKKWTWHPFAFRGQGPYSRGLAHCTGVGVELGHVITTRSTSYHFSKKVQLLIGKLHKQSKHLSSGRYLYRSRHAVLLRINWTFYHS